MTMLVYAAAVLPVLTYCADLRKKTRLSAALLIRAGAEAKRTYETTSPTLTRIKQLQVTMSSLRRGTRLTMDAPSKAETITNPVRPAAEVSTTICGREDSTHRR